ncbi:MAG: radical SAM protein [Myxococcales bacterium]|nr:radical SAM protein [Myxococcales bacterium]
MDGSIPTPDVSALRLASVDQGRLRCGPEVLQINLQNACNLNCTFCWNHSPLTPYPPARWYAQRLSEAHLDNVLASIPKLMPGRVQLSGRGEPTLHPGARRLLEALRELGVPVTIQTNGVGGLEPEAFVELGVERLADLGEHRRGIVDRPHLDLRVDPDLVRRQQGDDVVVAQAPLPVQASGDAREHDLGGPAIVGLDEHAEHTRDRERPGVRIVDRGL